MKHKILSLCLAVLLLGCLPLTAGAEENVYFEYDCGAAGHLSYQVETDGGESYAVIRAKTDMDVTGELAIPSQLPAGNESVPVRVISGYAFSGNTGLTRVILPEGVQSIENGAFNACSSLKSLNIPASVEAIGQGAFGGVPCSIAVAEGNRHFASLEGGFLCELYEEESEGTSVSCKRLLHCPRATGDLEIPEGITQWESSALPSTGSYTSVTIPASLSASVITERNSPFEFRFLSAENWKVAEGAAYTAVNGALFNADGTVLLKYPSGKTTCSVPSQVTALGAGAFRGCSFREANLSSLHITELPVLAFSQSRLETVMLPEALTQIGGFAFQDCAELRTLSLPDGVTSLDTGAFSGCVSLTELHLSNGITDIGIEGSWEGRPVFSPEITITVNEDHPVYSSDSQGCLYKKDGTGTPVKLLRAANSPGPVVLPSTVTELANGAFYGCEDIPSVTLPEALETIGVMAFQNCISLQELTIPAGVTNIYGLCAKNLSGAKAPVCRITVEEGSTAFYSHDGALYRLDSNELIYAPNRAAMEISPDARSIGMQAFAKNTALTGINIPEGITEIGAYAFSGCSSLRQAAFPEGLKRISQGAFQDTALTEVTLPNTINYMGTRVFENCNALSRIKTADSAAQAAPARAKMRRAAARSGDEPVDGRLDDVIVADCPELTTLEIPGDVREIAATIYENCPKLARIYVPAGVSVICEEAFAGLDSLTLYGEAGSYAETFAEAHQIPFVSGKPQDTPPPVTPPVSDDPIVETVTTESGSTVTITTQPEGDKTIEVKTPSGETVADIKLPADPGAGKKFVDVKEKDWFNGAVDKATAYGLFNGTSDTTFSPNTGMSRGMVAQVLYNLSGQTKYGLGTGTFTDVKSGQWYQDAVDWASKAGVVNGITETSFAPDRSVTREQLVTMLYRYAKAIGADTKTMTELTSFPDASKVSSYAQDAMKWAVANGFIGGRAQNGKDYIAPGGTASRAEVAAILTRFVEFLKK